MIKDITLFNVYLTMDNGRRLLLKECLPSDKVSDFLKVYSRAYARNNIQLVPVNK